MSFLLLLGQLSPGANVILHWLGASVVGANDVVPIIQYPSVKAARKIQDFIEKETNVRTLQRVFIALQSL